MKCFIQVKILKKTIFPRFVNKIPNSMVYLPCPFRIDVLEH